MSNAKWCDHGNHAFSERDMNAQTFTMTKYHQDRYGNNTPVSLVKDICGECAGKAGLLELPAAGESGSGDG